jgi:hypothetical protein
MAENEEPELRAAMDLAPAFGRGRHLSPCPRNFLRSAKNPPIKQWQKVRCGISRSDKFKIGT